jgi:hypothetical protein
MDKEGTMTTRETHDEYIARMTAPLDLDESYAGLPSRIMVSNDTARRMASVARDFHVNLDALTDRQYLALAIECGHGR